MSKPTVQQKPADWQAGFDAGASGKPQSPVPAGIDRRTLQRQIARGTLILIVSLLAYLMLISCAAVGLNSAVKTNQLTPGMTSQEVTQLLGQPASTQFINGYVIWKYSLHRPWVGYIPYYMAFDPQSMRLLGWQENMDEYYQTQALWLKSLPQQNNINIQGTVQHNVNIR